MGIGDFLSPQIPGEKFPGDKGFFKIRRFKSPRIGDFRKSRDFSPGDWEFFFKSGDFYPGDQGFL